VTSRNSLSRVEIMTPSSNSGWVEPARFALIHARNQCTDIEEDSEISHVTTDDVGMKLSCHAWPSFSALPVSESHCVIRENNRRLRSAQCNKLVANKGCVYFYNISRLVEGED
jgi:hypothetical protein